MKYIQILTFLLPILLFAQTKQSLIVPLKHQDTVIKHKAYNVSYNTKYRQANWVAYEFTSLELTKNVKRTNQFKSDPKIKHTDNAVDYYKSGYDKGHLAPAGDMCFSDTAMVESFYFSNMSPQVPGFNRGCWKKVEEQVRTWVALYDTLYIVTGPVLTENLTHIGPHKIAIPEYYYKVVYSPKKKAIGFLMKNEANTNEITNFTTTIDKIETLTGIDFFIGIEEKLESELCIPCWTWK